VLFQRGDGGDGVEGNGVHDRPEAAWIQRQGELRELGGVKVGDDLFNLFVGQFGDDSVKVVVPVQQRHHGQQVVRGRGIEGGEQCVQAYRSGELRHGRVLVAAE
jgi:hypothetical protein